MEFKLEVEVDSAKVETIVVSYLKELHKRLLDEDIKFKRKNFGGDISKDALFSYKVGNDLMQSVQDILEGLMDPEEFKQFVTDAIQKSWAWEVERNGNEN